MNKEKPKGYGYWTPESIERACTSGAMVEKDGLWYPAQPCQYQSIIDRIRGAWAVLTYKADPLYWYFEKGYKRTPKGMIKEEKCVCGEQTTFGGADVEIGGVCHRTENPCFVILTPPKNSVEEIIDKLSTKVTDYGFNDEYGYYNDWKDEVKVIIEKEVKSFLLSEIAQAEERVLREVKSIVDVPEEKTVNVMEYAIRRKILEAITSRITNNK